MFSFWILKLFSSFPSFQWFLETCSLGVCLNELVQLEHNEISIQCKLKAAHALFYALDCCKDGIIVTGPNHDIQFINHAIEKLLGFRLEDVLGKSAHDLQRSDSFKADIVESINMQVNKGKVFSLFSLFFIRCMKKNYLNYEFILCEGMGRNYFPQKKIWWMHTIMEQNISHRVSQRVSYSKFSTSVIQYLFKRWFTSVSIL